MNFKIYIISSISSFFCFSQNNTQLNYLGNDNQYLVDYVKASSELSRLLNAIRLAVKTVNHELNKAGLVDIIGATRQTNHSDEQQQKLDVFPNQAFKKALINRDIVCGFASEEEDSYVSISSTTKTNQIFFWV